MPKNLLYVDGKCLLNTKSIIFVEYRIIEYASEYAKKAFITELHTTSFSKQKRRKIVCSPLTELEKIIIFVLKRDKTK